MGRKGVVGGEVFFIIAFLVELKISVFCCCILLEQEKKKKYPPLIYFSFFFFTA